MHTKISDKRASSPPAHAAAKSPPPKSVKTAKPQKPGKVKMSLQDAMDTLRAAGSEQARKTHLRHGAKEPLFGVSFATLKVLHKSIGVDHALALQLWDTENLDARNLAVKIVDPSQMATHTLDAWALWDVPRTCGAYVAEVTSESPHGLSRVNAWLASEDEAKQATGWTLAGVLAMRDEALDDSWFLERLAHIEASIQQAPNALLAPMNAAVIRIGCRNPALRKAAVATAVRMGKVTIDHGNTACKTPDAAIDIDKAWAHSTAKGFDSPAAHERSRESARLRC